MYNSKIIVVEYEVFMDLQYQYLDYLENESIYIIREVIAECKNPAMLYSIGKDSAVLLHLILKAFFPAKPPIPLVHVDTLWKFHEMIDFRDKTAKSLGMDLIVYSNPEGKKKNISPFIHGSAMHTDIMKTKALKQMIDIYKFDALFGGARRDEEKSRAKERIFSFRDTNHCWNPKEQRPEIWKLYNSRHHKGESIRVFPLSNWTELDIWCYIYKEKIPIPSLYFAKKRKVADFCGAKILLDDDRVPKEIAKNSSEEFVRFRTLGCYPLTGAIQSNASTLEEIIEEVFENSVGERCGRVIDSDENASMEQKKKEGYF